MHSRRHFVAAVGTVAVAAALPGCTTIKGDKAMFGLIGKMKAQPGQRAALAAILLEGISGMPGCLSYIVAEDSGDADALWITEVWDSKESHAASLSLPAVKDAIARGKPLIASFGEYFQTVPLGGQGLASV
jgi:quinol monooxygenase YgiN